MRKSDERIKNIVTAAIKRHAIDIDKWENTKLWDSLSESIKLLIKGAGIFKEGELGILAYFESKVYWNVITTRGVVVSEGAEIAKVDLDEIESYEFGDFKGIIRRKKTEEMKLKLKSGGVRGFRYETGNPSMGAVYGIKTLVTVGKAGSGTAV